MKNDVFQKLIYQLVSKLFVLPIYKFVFRGHLIGRENIPKKNSFIMVSNHGSLLDPPLLDILRPRACPNKGGSSKEP